MENSERGSESKLPKGFRKYVPTLPPIGSDATVDRTLTRKLRTEDAFPHRLMPGAPIQTIEDLQKHTWVYALPWHKAVHKSVMLNQQAWWLVYLLSADKIREAIEMTDGEVFNEKQIGLRAAYLARIEYRERLFDHASAIRDSVASVPDYSADQSVAQTARRPAN